MPHLCPSGAWSATTSPDKYRLRHRQHDEDVEDDAEVLEVIKVVGVLLHGVLDRGAIRMIDLAQPVMPGRAQWQSA